MKNLSFSATFEASDQNGIDKKMEELEESGALSIVSQVVNYQVVITWEVKVLLILI